MGHYDVMSSTADQRLDAATRNLLENCGMLRHTSNVFISIDTARDFVAYRIDVVEGRQGKPAWNDESEGDVNEALCTIHRHLDWWSAPGGGSAIKQSNHLKEAIAASFSARAVRKQIHGQSALKQVEGLREIQSLLDKIEKEALAVLGELLASLS